MKKVLTFSLILLMFIITGCSNNSKNESYSGSITDLSKKYLSKGYAVNVYRGTTPLGDDEESYGKAYINMSFGILTEYVCTAEYDPNADYNIKKVIVSNVRILSTSKMGIAEDLYIMKQYSQYVTDPHVEVKGKETKYELVNEPAHSSGVQSNIMVNLNKIALYDQAKSPAALSGNQPTLEQIYNELGITKEEVTLKVGFRVELITVSGKTLYKDYEVTVPPTNMDITGSEFHFEFYETDTNKMEPFKEKD